MQFFIWCSRNTTTLDGQQYSASAVTRTICINKQTFTYIWYTTWRSTFAFHFHMCVILDGESSR